MFPITKLAVVYLQQNVWRFSSHSRIFLVLRRHHGRWRAANFDLYSVLMAIKQWCFFNMPHLLWHGASVYNGHLRDTHTYCRAFSSGAVTTCFYDLYLSRLGFEHPTFRLRGERSSLLRHRRGTTEWTAYTSLYTGIRTNIMILDELVARHRKSERRVREWRTGATPYRRRQEQNRNCNITES